MAHRRVGTHYRMATFSDGLVLLVEPDSMRVPVVLYYTLNGDRWRVWDEPGWRCDWSFQWFVELKSNGKHRLGDGSSITLRTVSKKEILGVVAEAKE